MEIPQVHNFGAGPCILPKSVMEKAAEAVINWNQLGLSILEVSHRSPEFKSVLEKTQLLVRELLKVPQDYSILFLQGGASTQFTMIPQSFLKSKGAYIEAGYFGQKAIKEAKYYGDVEIIASSKDRNFTYIPDWHGAYTTADYIHTTSNNTIEGTEMFEFPKLGIPHFCDMSSDIFSREINVRDFDMIYAGAQKNLGPAGLTLVIMKNELIDGVKKSLPAMADYRVFKSNNSLYNTPPVFSIYVSMLNLLWLKDIGGVSEIEKRNIKKANVLYAEIDRNPMFCGLASIAHRSRMNVTFKLIDDFLDAEFLAFAHDYGIRGIKGYRTVGGFRASLYNALSLSSVMTLVTAMQDFEKLKSTETVQSEKSMYLNSYA